MTATAKADLRQPAASRYLTLTLGRELYAVNALRVREIIRPQATSPVPKSPRHILGVMNLRGKVIPVIDLRIKFDLEFSGQTDRTCVVVVEVGKDIRPVGLMVDEVQEVVTLNGEEIQDAPAFGELTHVPYVSGLAKGKDSLMILLDVDRLVAEEQTGVA